MYRARIDGFHELPEDKQPPRGIWDKPFALKKFLKDAFSGNKEKDTSTTDYSFDLEDVE